MMSCRRRSPVRSAPSSRAVEPSRAAAVRTELVELAECGCELELGRAARLEATLEQFDGIRAHEALERLRVVADIGRLSERDRFMATLAAITASAGKAAVRRSTWPRRARQADPKTRRSGCCSTTRGNPTDWAETAASGANR